jgi:hypothetical protein
MTSGRSEFLGHRKETVDVSGVVEERERNPNRTASSQPLEFWTHDDRQATAALSRGLTVHGAG